MTLRESLQDCLLNGVDCGNRRISGYPPKTAILKVSVLICMSEISYTFL